MSYHTGSNNNRSSQPSSTPASTPPVPIPPPPTQRSGNTNQSDRNPLREVTSTGSDRGGFEARECPDEAPDGNGKPLTDDGSVWENPPPCSTIFVWDYEGGVWVRQEGEGKPDDAIEGGGTGEGSGLTDKQGKAWQFYRNFIDWYVNQILLILSETHPYQKQGHWDGLTAKEAMQRFAEYLELLWGMQDPNRCLQGDPNYDECDPKYWPIPTRPRGWDRDRLEEWERENGYTTPPQPTWPPEKSGRSSNNTGSRSTPEQRSGGSNSRAGLDGSAGNNRGEHGPFSVGGYCPLYTTSRAAVAASPFPDMVRLGEKSKGFHVHVIDGGRYYMPNGLVMGETQFHGDCPSLIPAPEFGDDGTVVNPEGYVPSVTIAGGKIRFPYKPSLVQNGSKDHMWYMQQRQEWRDECKINEGVNYCYGDTAKEREGKGMEFWKTETDEEWRDWVRDHLSKESFFSNNDPIYADGIDAGIQTWIERFGEDPIAVRNTYLNENTTGWILLDWESPVNLGNLLNTSQSDLRAFIEGVIRRINILREFMPNAKFGLWRFGDGRNPRYRGSEVNQFLRRQVFASGIKYQGKTLFDALDFLSPTLYQYAYFEYNEPIALSRILNGERVQRSKDTCDSIFEEHGEVKPVVPIIHNTYLLNNTEYAGADADDAALPGDDLAYQLNALEIEYWEEYPSHFAYWYARTEDLYDHYYHRDLLLRYYDETYRAPYQGGDKGNQGTPVPIDPNYSLETGLETETIGEPPEERRLENDNSNNSQRNTYENGKRIPGNFPTAYQNSINQAVPDGQKCGNCKLFSQKSGYCSAWKATANKNYWCQSYVPRVNITMNGAAVSSSGEMFSVRDSNKKLITYRKGSTVLYNGELYEVTKNVFGQLPDKSSSFVKITNIDDNVIDGGSFGETSSVTRTPVRRSSSGSSSSSSSSGGGY